MARILLYAFITLLGFSCSAPEKLLTDERAERIYFGKSGGFTNIPVRYVLIDRAYIFKIEQDKFIAICKPSKNEITQFNLLLEQSNIHELNLNEPGNMTYYIRIVKNNNEKEIKWTDTSLNSGVKELYKALVSMVNKDI